MRKDEATHRRAGRTQDWPARERPAGGLPVAGLAALSLLVAAPTHAHAFELFGYRFFEDETPVSPDAQPYTIEMTVASEDDDLVAAVRAASLLYSEKDEAPPPSTPALLSRARAEYERIVAALYQQGRYGGSVAIAVGGRPLESIEIDDTLPRPVAVTIAVDPGPEYHFGRVVMDGRAPVDAFDFDRKRATPEKIGLLPGAPAKSEAVLQSETALIDDWRRLGHPKAEALPRSIVADHAARRVDVAIGVRPGPAAVYGPTAVEGTARMDPSFVAWQAGLVPGKAYDPEDLDRAMKRLRRLQVFASTRVVEADRVNPDGSLPMTIVVSERPLHVFGVGASYATTDGAGLEGYWEHRNLFGEAERLRLEARVSGIDSVDPDDFTYVGAVTFIKPGVLTPMTDFTAIATALREVYDPYSQNTVRGRVGLAHEFTETLTGKVFVNAETDEVEDGFGDRDLVVASLPAELVFDNRDDLLEPTEGFRVKLAVEPFHEFEFGNTGAVTRLDASTYWALDADARFVLAARAAIGSLFGGEAYELPADRLFFAGGGGSVRGYAYRSLGPKLADGTIVGGRSLLEGSLELRTRITGTIGAVAFVDAGGAFEDTFPDFSQSMKIAAGLGLRYYTGIGAIRVDAAVPLNPDPEDPNFALYIGLGQSF